MGSNLSLWGIWGVLPQENLENMKCSRTNPKANHLYLGTGCVCFLGKGRGEHPICTDTMCVCVCVCVMEYKIYTPLSTLIYKSLSMAFILRVNFLIDCACYL